MKDAAGGTRAAGPFAWRAVWLAVLVTGFVVPRALILERCRDVLIDSDEAIVGLMGRHILHGHFPIWLYGIAYNGSIEAYWSAVLFAIFGATPLVLKMEPLSWFAGFLVVHYFLAKEVSDEMTARWATLVLAISPAFLTVWSFKVVGCYMSTLFLGTLSLWVAARILRRGLTTGRAVTLGLLLGLSWWTSALSLAFIVPIVALLTFDLRKRLWSAATVYGAAAFLAASLPWWIYNATHRLASLRIRSQVPHAYASPIVAVKGLLRRGIPILLGARPEHGLSDFFPLAGLFMDALFAIAVGLAIYRLAAGRRSQPNANGQALLLAVVLMMTMLFVVSGYGANADEPRYLIPIYAAIYALIFFRLRRGIAAALAAILLAIHLYGTFQIQRAELGTTLNAEPTAEVLAFLRRNGVRNAYAPYWSAYRLTFESQEEIIFSPPEGDFVRYEPHLERVKNDPAPAYVRLNAAYEDSQKPNPPPPTYTKYQVGNYDVYLAKPAR